MKPIYLVVTFVKVQLPSPYTEDLICVSGSRHFLFNLLPSAKHLEQSVSYTASDGESKQKRKKMLLVNLFFGIKKLSC